MVENWLPAMGMELGALYRLDARRQAYGVWDGAALLGIQIEMGWPTLSHEAHWDQGGSAKPVALVGRVPEGIELLTGWTECIVCGDRTMYSRELQAHQHVGADADHEAAVETHTVNRMLLTWLGEFERAADRR